MDRFKTSCARVLVSLLLSLVLSRGSVLAGSARPKATLFSEKDFLRAQPVAPQRGAPLPLFGAFAYWRSEITNLLHQGRIPTNLLAQAAAPKSCRLQLAAPLGRDLTPNELAEALEKGGAQVVGIAKRGRAVLPAASGSGFFITESGALVTCWHVIDIPKIFGFVVMTRDGRVCPVREILAVNRTNDLAILQVEGHGFTPLPVVAAARQGEPVWVLSHPAPFPFVLGTGIVSNFLVVPFRHGDMLYMDITADFASGSSGAPVLNQQGAVIGIADAIESVGSYPEEVAGYAQQMVIKHCLPSASLLQLVGQP